MYCNVYIGGVNGYCMSHKEVVFLPNDKHILFQNRMLEEANITEVFQKCWIHLEYTVVYYLGWLVVNDVIVLAFTKSVFSW